MKKMRTFLFWLHLAAGIIAGTVILGMSVSGILIAYERQMMGWFERDTRTVHVPAGAPRLEVGELLEKLQQLQPGKEFSFLTLYSDPARTVRVAAGRESVFFLNPYTGEVTAEKNRFARLFFRFMTDWHRWLAQEGKGKEVGKAITGAAGLCFFFLLLSGLFLWIPKTWSSHSLKRIGVLDWSLKGKARDWNWHNVWGVWAAPVILVITLTGIIISYTWATHLLYTLTGGEPPPVHKAEPGGPGRSAPKQIHAEGLDVLIRLAQKQWPEWKSIQFSIPHSAKGPITFNLDAGNGIRPDRRAQLTISRPVGEITSWEPYESWKTGRQLRSWVRSIHTGEVGGILGQTIAVFGAFSAAVLVWTGFSLGLRRLASYLRQRKAGAPSSP